MRNRFQICVRGFFVFAAIVLSSEHAYAAPEYASTYSVTADSGQVGTPFQLRKISDGTVYVMGSSTTKMFKFSADGSTATVIDLSQALGTGPNSFIVSTNKVFIHNPTSTLSRFDISGTTATYVTSTSVNTGGAATSFNQAGNLLLSKSTTLYTLSTTDLSSAGNNRTLAQAASRIGVDSNDNFIYLTTSRRIRKAGFVDDVDSAGTILVNSVGTSIRDFHVAPAGTLYYADATPNIQKFSPAGTALWTYAPSGAGVLTNIVSITVDTSGLLLMLTNTGTIKTYYPIATPTNLTADSTEDTVELSWDTPPSVDFAGVTIRRSTASAPATATDGTAVVADLNDHEYTDTSLSPGTTYYYSIFFETSDGYYGQKASVTTTTDSDSTPPAAPTIVAEKATINGNIINLSWNVPSGTSTFTLKRTLNGSPETTVQTGIPSSTTTYTDTGLTDGTYVYYLYALDEIPNTSSAGVSSALTIDTTAPSAPTITAEKATINGNIINLSWNVPSGTSTFTLKRSLNGEPETTVQTGIASSTTTYQQTGLTDGSYVYSLYAVDAYTNISNAGLSSTLVIDTTAPNAPTITAEKATINGNIINLSWNVPSGTSTFTLKRIYNGGSETTVQTGIASSTTIYLQTGLDDGTYVYHLYAVDAYTNTSNAGTSSTLTIDTTAPAAPSISAEKATINGNIINLSWNTPSGTDTFTLKRSFNGGFETTIQTGIASSTTTYQQTDLADGTYTYSIYAVDAFTNISNAGISSTLTIDTTAPSAPTITAEKATATGSTINLSWNVPSGTDTFTLKRSFNGEALTTVQTGISSATTTYQQTGLAEGTYTYHLYAVDAYTNISTAGTSSTLTIDTTATAAVTDFAASPSGSTINLSWTNPVASDFASVTIRRSSSSYPASVTDGTGVLSGSTATSYSNTGLSDGVYYYSIFAVDTIGNISAAAQATATVDTTPTSAPSSFTAAASASTINLSWTNPVASDFASVTIRRSTTSYPTSVSDGDAVLSGSTATSYTNTSLSDGIYYYSIFALDSFGNISSSAQATATVDTTPTSAPASPVAAVSGSTILLTWANPVASDFASITVRRSTSGYPATITDGTLVAQNLTTTALEDAELSDGVYYYSIFAKDTVGNISTAAQATATIDTTVSVLAIAVTPPTDLESVQVNDNINFALSVTNSGGKDAENTELTFTLSENLQFISAEIVEDIQLASLLWNPLYAIQSLKMAVTDCTGTSVITCNIGTVSAGHTISLSVTTKVIAEGALSFSVAGSDGSSSDSAMTTTEVVGASGGGGCSLNPDRQATTSASGSLMFFAAMFACLWALRKRP